jgi:predicted transcriptional regulator
MSENNVSAEGMKEILHQLPTTFQRFVSIYNEAEKKARDRINNNNNNFESSQDSICDKPLEESEFEKIRRNLSEIGLLIMESIRNDGSNSKELAGKLGVSIDTIKRRYKDLLIFGMIKTTRKRGVRLTQRGLQFISKLKLKLGEGPIVAE